MKMKRWLHYVGSQYNPARFTAEAREHGFARRIPLNALARLNFGDVVYFARWEGATEGGRFREGIASIFARGVVSRIYIEDPEAWQRVVDRLRREGKIVAVQAGGGRVVKRRCGYYITGGRERESYDRRFPGRRLRPPYPNPRPVFPFTGEAFRRPVTVRDRYADAAGQP